MNLLKSGLYTDMYQLRMMQAYYNDSMHNQPAAFDYFFRILPFNGGFVVFAGLSELIDSLSNIRFSNDDIAYLKKLKFTDEFLYYLSTFSFKGKIISVEEGTIVFPYEPVLTMDGNLAEVQLVETLLLNILNFNSLIATKAARMRIAAPDKILSEFGLRRAQGFGGIQASKAAVIGGFDSTSNVFSAMHFDLKPEGTMAHSFIQSFNDELTAFRSFAASHPLSCILLVDTYNTLLSGVPNAIIVAKELRQKGYNLKGIRLDSGDLAYLSIKSREMLDAEGLHDVKIVASNQLDEDVIKSLIEQGARIDIFGVGTSLATGHPDAALDGVYKLSMYDNQPRMKISESLVKATLPGLKKIIRFTDEEGMYQADAVCLREEKDVQNMIHPFEKEKSMLLDNYNAKEIHKVIMEGGEIKAELKSAEVIREEVKVSLTKLPAEYKRFINPHIYKVGLSEKLMELREGIREKFLK
jgi:nicotinate phosphoribosyltransferase